MNRYLLITAMFVPGLARAFCFAQAASTYQLDEALIRGVAQVESSMRPEAMNLTHIKRTGTYDIGPMQINSSWLPKLAKFGITEQMLKEPCQNVLVGTWILSQHLRETGDNWWGVGSYNASCKTLSKPDCERARYTYAWKIYRAMQKHAGQPTTGAPQRVGAAQMVADQRATKPRIESVQFDDVTKTSSARAATSEGQLAYMQDAQQDGQQGADGDGDNAQEFTN